MVLKQLSRRRDPRLGRALRGISECIPCGLRARRELGCREYLSCARELALPHFGACSLAFALGRLGWVERRRRLAGSWSGPRGSEKLSPLASLERCSPREERSPALRALLLRACQQHARGEQEQFPCSGSVRASALTGRVCCAQARQG